MIKPTRKLWLEYRAACDATTATAKANSLAWDARGVAYAKWKAALKVEARKKKKVAT